MSTNVMCRDASCANGGVPVVDANSIFYLVEGAISRAEDLYPDASRSELLPHILCELDDYLKTIRLAVVLMEMSTSRNESSARSRFMIGAILSGRVSNV